MSEWPGALPEREVVLDFADSLADLARGIVRPRFRTTHRVSWKDDASPVTEVDRAVESALRARIRERFPEHGIVGEELGSHRPPGQPAWIIDPIDGTKAFISGRPLFGTLIALVADEVPVLGVLEVPALGERWLGAAGTATTLGGLRTAASSVERLAEANLSATTIDMFTGTARDRFDALGRRVAFRAFGGDCYAYGLLACGWVDLVVEAEMQPYDYMALVPIVQGAGGVMSDWSGRPLGASGGSAGQVLAAANAALHRQAVEVLGS